MDLKRTRIEVIPNAFNESGCVFVIYRKTWFPWFWEELGRCITTEQLRSFAMQYEIRNGRTLENAMPTNAGVTGAELAKRPR